jgi:hypothetical protein
MPSGGQVESLKIVLPQPLGGYNLNAIISVFCFLVKVLALPKIKNAAPKNASIQASNRLILALYLSG